MFKWRDITKLMIIILILVNSSLVGVLILSPKVAKAQILDNVMPVVFVDPQDAAPSPGDSLTVSVKIFNLTDSAYLTNETWLPGNYIGPKVGFGAYNYTFGNVYGLDVKFSWDPTLLDYVSHIVTIPVTEHPDGILYGPLVDAADDVDEGAGTYHLGKASLAPALPFNSPDANATIFTMTFNVIKEGSCILSLDHVDIASKQGVLIMHKREVPHLAINGQIKTPLAATRIEIIRAGAKVGQQVSEPVILGEDADVSVGVTNDGDLVDNYTATLSLDGTPLVDGVWTNRSLNPGESDTLNYTLLSADLTRGNHTIRADATITHGNVTLLDHLSKILTVIYTPTLDISGSSLALPRQDLTFDGSQSTHGDPAGSIQNFTWTLTEPGATQPRYFYSGETMRHTLNRNAKNGTWIVTLTVEDSWGVEYDPLRPATDPYMLEMTFEVGLAPPPNLFSIENIVLVLILVAIIGVAGFYLYRRSR